MDDSQMSPSCLEELIKAIESRCIKYRVEWIEEIRGKRLEAPLDHTERLNDLLLALDNRDEHKAAWSLIIWFDMYGYLARPYKLLEFSRLVKMPCQNMADPALGMGMSFF